MHGRAVGVDAAGAMAAVVWTPNPGGCMRKSLGNNLVQRCLVGMPQFLSSTNFLFQIFNAVNPSGTIPISKALCFTVYSLPLISRTGILVG